jgi:5-methylcytosine-specific restriction protein A
MKDQLPFIPEHIYNRRQDIHAKYGGNRQSGICPTFNHNYIFIFSGKSGTLHGYQDGWDNDMIFSYTGQGQSGDMTFTRGNLALKDHLKNGKRVFLFESESKGFVRFKSELELYDVDYFDTKDTSGANRIGIKFFFQRKGTHVPIQPSLFNKPLLLSEPQDLYKINLPISTERIGLVTSRVGQGAYRKRIVHRWEYKCAVTGYNNLNILIASHIVPWMDSNDHERLDVNNGILLSPTYDALFDQHLISFENNGKIILSDTIESQAYQKIGLSGKEKILHFNSLNQNYLDRHRLRFSKSS